MNPSFAFPFIEANRLASLRHYPVRFQKKEASFDELTQLAALICDKPVALITFIDETTQWIKSSSVPVGIEKMDRSHTVCQYTIQQDGVLEIKDALLDKKFCRHPLVIGGPCIRYYAGISLTTPGGFPIGTLCVMDTRPGSLSGKQKQSLLYLSNAVVNLLELNKQKQLLSDQVQKVEAATQAKSDFLSTMSHEIRTPLHGIAGLAHLLLQENPQQHQMQYIKSIKSSAHHLMSIVNDVLDFSKIEAGQIALEKVPFGLKELILDVKAMNQIKAHDKGIALELKYDDTLPQTVTGDPLGGVTIEVQPERKASHQTHIRFTVKDTGIGIPKEQQHRLFQRFTQADLSTTRKFGGTGLGLVITKKLLKLQGSDIEMKSEENKGSVFTFVLPFDHPVQEQVPWKAKPTGLPPFHGERILVVEDNEVNCLIAQKILGAWNLSVTITRHGKEALEKLKVTNFDAVLMDIQMPVMDGYEATKQIRKAGYLPSALPIIGLSASTVTHEIELAKASGMNDFVSKPFNLDELHTKLKKYINHNV
jgi:two-component system, sensor histidine kinase